MATIKPFKAYRPLPEFAQYMAAKPYDVLNSEEAREEASGNPYSFLRVTKAEITLPEDTYSYAEEVYKQARLNFDHFVDEGVVEQDQVPSMYIYRQVMQTGRKDGAVWDQTGVMALSSVNDYFNDIIKKHEHTRPENIGPSTTSSGAIEGGPAPGDPRGAIALRQRILIPAFKQ